MSHTNTMPPLLIRADASVQTGAGHVMRCLALAQAWHEHGGAATFLSCCPNETLRQRIVSAGLSCLALEKPHPDRLDLDTTLAALAQLSTPTASHGTPWLVLDGYHFDTAYQQAIRAAGYRLLVIDDMAHLPQYAADVLLNQNLHATALRYHCNAEATLLLGPRYALLRPEFLAWRGWQRRIPDVARRVLVTMGGSDPDNATLQVVQALQQVGRADLEVTVVLGAGYPHALPTWTETCGGTCTVVRSVHDMPALMAWADVAVSASGSTCWELAFMGLPAALVVLAENQQPVAHALQAAGIALHLGRSHALSPAAMARLLQPFLLAVEQRTTMARCGQQLIDGQGVRRVMRQILGDTIRLRPVQAEDCRMLWEWANDPEVRQASFTSEPIPWERHVQWFASALDNCDCTIYVATQDKDIPIGQVRCDIAEKEATVSVSLDKNFRNHGYGTIILQKASQQFFQSSHVQVIHAYIKQDNAASVRAFLKAGFEPQGTTVVHGCQAFHLILQKKDIQ